MTDKQLQEIEKIILKKKELKRKKQRILELQQDPKVREYIDLVNDYNVESKNENLILIRAGESNKILFKYGYYNIRNNGNYSSVRLVYRDLETETYYWCLSFDEYIKMFNFCFASSADKIEFENRHCEFYALKEYFFEHLSPEQRRFINEEVLEINNPKVKIK